MGGLITHLSVATISSLLVLLILRKSNFRLYSALAIFLGNLSPDLLDFGVFAFKSHSLHPAEIMIYPGFQAFARFAHSPITWSVAVTTLAAVFLVLFLTKFIKRKTFSVVLISLALFLVGVVTHLFIDATVNELWWWL